MQLNPRSITLTPMSFSRNPKTRDLIRESRIPLRLFLQPKNVSIIISLVLRALTASLLFLPSCKSPHPMESNPKFAIYTNDYRLLKENFDLILSPTPSPIPVCISWLGFEEAGGNKAQPRETTLPRNLLASSRRKYFEDLVNSSLQSWFEHDIFPQVHGTEYAPSRRTVFTHFDNEICPGSFWSEGNIDSRPKGLKVLVFSDGETQARTFCDNRFKDARKAGLISCSNQLGRLTSQGDFHSMTIVMSPMLLGGRPRPRDMYAPTMLHEMGHVFGLFDQYRRTDMPAAPRLESTPSIMAYTTNLVTQDDLAGILAAYNFGESGRANCTPSDKVQGKSKGLTAYIQYCQIINRGVLPGRNDHD